MNNNNNIVFKGKVYSQDLEVYEDNNEVEGLTYDNYIQRITRASSKLKRTMTREEALTIPLKGQPQKLVYKNKKYKSLSNLYNNIDISDRDLNVSLHSFISRYSDIQAERPELTKEEVAFIALNAKRRQSLNLKIEQYQLQELIRKGGPKHKIDKLLKELQ